MNAHNSYLLTRQAGVLQAKAEDIRAKVIVTSGRDLMVEGFALGLEIAAGMLRSQAQAMRKGDA